MSSTHADVAPSFRERIQRPHLPALDGLRAIAVTSVILYHMGFLPSAIGSLGVSLFFVISGFLITHLLLKEHEATGRISLRRFYARRALRIFPAYYVFLAVSFGVMAALKFPISPRLVLGAVFYFNDYVQAFGHDMKTMISHSWSLAIEEQFYLLWPLGLVVLLRRGANGALAIGVVVLAIVAWRITLVELGFRPYIYYAFETRVDQLLIGCALAILSRMPRFDRSAAMASRFAILPLLSAAATVVISMRVPRILATVGYSIVGGIFALFLMQTVMLSEHPAWRWLDSRPARFVGKLSYPLYLYHGMAPTLVKSLARNQRWVVELALTGAVTLGLAMASYYVVERPFLALKDRMKPRTPAVGPELMRLGGPAVS